MSESTQLHMRRPTLDGLPSLEIPDGFALRDATVADLSALAVLLAAAFPELDWPESKAHSQLFADLTVKKVLVIYEAESGKLAATAAARLLPEKYPNAGYVHWVGADPALRGRGLGRLVSLAVLHAFREMGCTSSVLDTDDFRLPAIKTYLALGFSPEPLDPSHEARWAALDGSFAKSRAARPLGPSRFP